MKLRTWLSVNCDCAADVDLACIADASDIALLADLGGLVLYGLARA